MSEWLSLSAYARVYNVSRNTVHKWRDSGLLEVWTVGAVVRIRNRPPAQNCSTLKASPSDDKPRGVTIDAHECAKH